MGNRNNDENNDTVEKTEDIQGHETKQVMEEMVIEREKSLKEYKTEGNSENGAPEVYSEYGPVTEGEFDNLICSGVISKRSILGTVFGPRGR